MDLLKAKIYLDKINRDFARMTKDPDNIMRIDVDIMLAYVRELYDAFLEERAAAAPTPITNKNESPAARRIAASPTRAAAPPAEPAPVEPPPPAPVREVKAAPPPPPPVREERPAPAAPPPPPEPVYQPEPAPPVYQAPPAPEPVYQAPPAPQPTHQAPTVPAFSDVPPEAEALFEHKEAKELSEKLSQSPIADLRKAIALNDRLLLTRELFGGDPHAFEATIAALNGFTDFEQARHYLIDHCVMRFGWPSKKHVETAKGFIRLVRRRYK